MNMKKAFLASILGMIGFGQQNTMPTRGEYNKPKQNTAKGGSLNTDMKEVRDREHGSMSRRIVRNIAKAIKADEKKEERIYDRKHNPVKRSRRFARA